MAKPRQAVVLIHGIGEQRPMETLRGFVLSVLGDGSFGAGHRTFYSKPDPNADGFELRRLRAFEGKADSDFIEFYWQHLMPIAAWQFLLSWLWLLMRRPSASMPQRFKFLWVACWLAFWVIVLGGLVSVVGEVGGYKWAIPSIPKLTGIAAATAGGAGYLVRSFVGDAAIYLNPHPRTVEARNRIRSAGVSLLERLQADGRYDRIIIVGHSLGSVIGYDVLTFAWSRSSDALRRAVEEGTLSGSSRLQDKLAASEALAATARGDIARWTQATRDLHYEQRRLGQRWLVTDFITAGSPLAHASLLLARGPADLLRRQEDRELPTSPPRREDDVHFSYSRPEPRQAGKGRTEVRVIDHAGLFATTVWKNFYFPCRHLFYGDLVGGAVAPMFGWGVEDVAVETRIRNGWLAHTEYWSLYSDMAADAAPLRLTQALDLTRSGLARRVAPEKRHRGEGTVS
jgi:hypothetical protein